MLKVACVTLANEVDRSGGNDNRHGDDARVGRAENCICSILRARSSDIEAVRN